MKTTLELPDQLLRKAKATAAERGQSLNEFVTQALRNQLALDSERIHASEPAWMEGFGKLKRCTRKPSACSPSWTRSSRSSNRTDVDSRGFRRGANRERHAFNIGLR
jgi:hypothetical protein